MRRATALLLGTLLPLLGWSGIGEAQSSVQVQGTIQAVDCQAQTIVLVGPDTSNTIAAAPYTVVLVNSTSIPLCALQQYVGVPATVWLLASGNEFTATRIDVEAQAVGVPLQPPSAPYPVVTTPLPVVGIVLGTVVVAGLVYLLTRDEDGHFYRYPYYGPYYRHYYRPEYRPYFGFYPALAPIITVPPIIVGVVLGVAVVGGLEYLLARDHDGRFYRYPYYGPYHRYYYRSEYRPYYGSYHDAPVRGAGTHWDVPTYRDPNRVPVPQGPSRWSPPGNQPTPAYRDTNRNPQTYRNDRRQDAPGGRQPRQRCESTTPNQACGGQGSTTR